MSLCAFESSLKTHKHLLGMLSLCTRIPHLTPHTQQHAASRSHETHMIAALDEELAQVAAHKARAARDEHAVLAAPRLGLDQRLGVAAAAL